MKTIPEAIRHARATVQASPYSRADQATEAIRALGGDHAQRALAFQYALAWPSLDIAVRWICHRSAMMGMGAGLTLDAWPRLAEHIVLTKAEVDRWPKWKRLSFTYGADQ